MNQPFSSSEAANGPSSEPPPNISVLMRTMGRASLAHAVDSVRRQSLPAFELVVLNAGGQPIPGRVFTTDASGSGSLKDQIQPQARNSVVFAITLEPESGVKSPTGEMYLISAS